MTDDGKIVPAAQYLAQRYKARESLDIMLQDCAPTTIEDAYKEQTAFLGLPGGYKMAYTSDEMRRLLPLARLTSQCSRRAKGQVLRRTI